MYTNLYEGNVIQAKQCK